MVWFSCTLTPVIVPSQWPCERSTAGRHASRATACTHLSEPGMASTGGRDCRESASVLLRFHGNRSACGRHEWRQPDTAWDRGLGWSRTRRCRSSARSSAEAWFWQDSSSLREPKTSGCGSFACRRRPTASDRRRAGGTRGPGGDGHPRGRPAEGAWPVLDASVQRFRGASPGHGARHRARLAGVERTGVERIR